MTALMNYLIPFGIGSLLYLCPPPDGMDPRGWHLLAIFMGTIVGLIFKPLPLGAVALISMVITLLTGVLPLEPELLSGYGSSVIWLVVYVFFIARGFIKTQLGIRIAFIFVRWFGQRSLGLGYSLVVTELLIAPFIPSIAARAGGIMYPVVNAISESLGSRPNDGTARNLGAFLCKVCYNGNLITSAMFLTAMASNPMIQSFAASQNIEITWTNWALAASVPGLISLILMPLFFYVFYPPKIKKFDHAVTLANDKLTAMGSMSKNEWMMAGIFLMMLLLWIFGEGYGIKTTTTALLGLCLLLVSKILTWDDILAEKEAWHTLVWFAILVTMAKYLQVFGVIDWFSLSVGIYVKDLSWPLAFTVLVLIYFYAHYLFASNTSHISAMYSAFLAVALSAGTPPLYAALALAFCSNLFSSMTHYGSSSSPIFFGSGYVPIGTWWRLGFMVSILNLIIWFGVGSLWWKVLGMW
jgi:DASS family divalent anion:Na+ symporter